MSNFWSGLGFGAAAGGILALLYAPQTGKELQAAIKAFAEESGLEIKEVKDAFERVQYHAAELQQVQTDIVQPTMKELNQLFDEFEFQSQARIKAIEKQSEKIELQVTQNEKQKLEETE